MKEKLLRFLIGRYGNDSLNKALLALILVLFVVYLFTRWIAVYIASLVFFVVIFYRMFSRDTQRRSRENLAYQGLIGRPKRFFISRKNLFIKSKTHRIYRCPACKQQLTVPKGKGNITITCPKCGELFKKKT